MAPVVAGFLALGTADVLGIDPRFVVILGVVASLATHLGRFAVRPVSAVTTGGAANPALSLGEDGASGMLSVTAIVAPAIALVLAVAVLVGVAFVWRRGRALGGRLRRRDTAAP